MDDHGRALSLFTAGYDFGQATLFARGLRRLLEMEGGEAVGAAAHRLLDELRITLKQVILRLAALGIDLPRPESDAEVSEVVTWLEGEGRSLRSAVAESCGAVGERLFELGALAHAVSLQLMTSRAHRDLDGLLSAELSRERAAALLDEAGLPATLLKAIGSAPDNEPATLYNIFAPHAEPTADDDTS